MALKGKRPKHLPPNPAEKIGMQFEQNHRLELPPKLSPAKGGGKIRNTAKTDRPTKPIYGREFKKRG